MSYKIFKDGRDITTRCDVTISACGVEILFTGGLLEVGEYLVVYKADPNAISFATRIKSWFLNILSRLLPGALLEPKTFNR